MSQDFLHRLLTLGHRDRRLADGEFLFQRDDPVEAMYVVRTGEVRLVRHQEDGTELVLQRAGPGELVAEASFFSTVYHCDGIAAGTAVVRVIPRQRARQLFRDDTTFAETWTAHLGHQVQQARFRSEVLARRTVAARLDAWLAWHDSAPVAKGQWKHVATQIGVSPEALYRELAHRRSNGSG